MKLGIKMILVLTSIALVSGLLLSYTYQSTKVDIERNKEIEKERAIKVVIPGTERFEEKVINVKNSLLVAYDKDGNLIGYAMLTEGTGFQGPIKLMVGFDTTLSRITGMEVLENVETPGLGNRIVEDWFKKQFKGRLTPIGYVKGKKPENPHNIQAISGATISSRSVVKIVDDAWELAKKEIKK